MSAIWGHGGGLDREREKQKKKMFSGAGVSYQNGAADFTINMVATM